MLTDLFCRYSYTYLMLELLCIWRLFPVLYWGLTYARGCFHPAYVRRHNVSVSLGSGRYTHNTMYAHVYTCTHCECKGHLTKFCYDRLHNVNLANKFVWVRKGANPHGPNRVWVPKATSILFDIGVDSHMTWEWWCLEVDAFRAKQRLLNATFKESLVRGPPWCGNIETYPHGFGNDL